MHQQPVCVTCGIVIRWQPTVIEAQTYCCLGCAQGGPCECDYDNLPELDAANAIVHQSVKPPRRTQASA